MANLKSILKKKSWTGRELGILEIANMCHNFEQRLAGKEDFSPIVEEERFTAMRRTLSTTYEKQIYNGYMDLHTWLVTRYNVAQSYAQQAFYRYYRLWGFMQGFSLAEDIYDYVSKLPKIMTRKQYEEEKAKGVQRYLYGDGEEKEERGDTLPVLIDRAVSYYLRLLEEEPRKANPLKAIKKAYSKEPVTSPLILSRYNEVFNICYYELEDGRRSDKMELEEWLEAICPNCPRFREPLKKAAEILKTRDPERLERVAMKLPVSDMEKTVEELDKATEVVPIVLKATEKLHEEPPQGLKKWDILESLPEFYPALYYAEGGDWQAEAQDLYSEYKELVDALTADIKERYIAKGEELPFTTPEEWDCAIFNWEQLYESNFYGFRDQVDKPLTVFTDTGRYREAIYGVAIIEDEESNKAYIDSNGYYEEPVIRNMGVTLDDYFTDSKNYASSVEYIEADYEILLESLYYLKGHNKALDLIANHYDIPEIKVFAYDIDDNFKTKIESYNGIKRVLEERIEHNKYTLDKERQEKKLETLKGVFPPIQPEKDIIPEENITKAVALFKDFKAFNNEASESFAMLLMKRPDSNIRSRGQW